MSSNKARFSTSTIINTTVDVIWKYISTTNGWEEFISDITTVSEGDTEIKLGDIVETVIGELKNQSTCVVHKHKEQLEFKEHYTVISPNGKEWEYFLITTFHLKQLDIENSKLEVIVESISDNPMMEWILECSETGWGQSLFNLKSVIELGIDVRNEIFDYPRLGIMNKTASDTEIINLGLDPNLVRGNIVIKCYDNGPAYFSGIKDGDLIITLDEYPVLNYRDFIKALGKFKDNRSVILVTLYRGDTKIETPVHLTYDDQFTGMVDPLEKGLEKIKEERILKSKK